MNVTIIEQWVRKIDLLSLRLLVSVVEEGGIGRAATRENMAASAATKRIQLLEESLGCQLFFRTARGTSLTPAGHIAVQHALAILHRLEALANDLSELSSEAVGRIRVCTTPTALVQFLAEDIARFTQQFPSIRFELQSSFTPVVIKAVVSGEADLGICSYSSTLPESVTVSPYHTELLSVAVSRHHALASQNEISFAELLGVDMIGWTPEGALMQELRTRAEEIGKSFAPKWRVSSMDAARALVQKGLGAVILPRGAIGKLEGEHDLCFLALAEGWAQRQLGILQLANQPVKPAVETFANFLCVSAK